MEVLAPAGNLEKVKYAIAYGADAVYAGSQDFSLRAKADTFDYPDLIKAVNFCHKHQKKLFVPLNIYAHNYHIPKLKDYIINLSNANVDAVIVSDFGVFDLVKENAPDLDIHISTQANVTSYQSVKAWQKYGAKRVILARELTFSEIREIREKCPDIELEMFIHGAMCISYSGRCLLSAFLNNRSANLGNCTQPCRWSFDLVEKSRPNQKFSVEEDSNGFYFMNSKDLCLWSRLEDIYKAGIDSIKIEGRMKSIYYVAAVTRSYNQSLSLIKNGKKPELFWREELDKISHRIYTEAFFDEFNANETQNYKTSTYIRDWQFVGNIIGGNDQFAKVQSYHKITEDDNIEIIFPDHKNDILIDRPQLFNENYEKISFTKPNSCFYLKTNIILPSYGIIRKKIMED